MPLLNTSLTMIDSLDFFDVNCPNIKEQLGKNVISKIPY